MLVGPGATASPLPSRPLARRDLARPTVQVARDLVGCLLVRRLPEGLVGGRIVETEAYLPQDPASHSFRGPTPRNRAMFGPAGHAYVYVSYGVHHCVNVVTEADGVGSAVLVRALEPIWGLDLMAIRRQVEPGRPRDLASGPGKLCQALAIDLALDGVDLLAAGGPLVLLPRSTDDLPEVAATPRIGITKATAEPWRFVAVGNRFLSRAFPQRLLAAGTSSGGALPAGGDR